MTTQNEGDLGRSIYMLKLAQAESDFGLKSQHDDTSQKTNLKTNPKVKLKLSIETFSRPYDMRRHVRSVYCYLRSLAEYDKETNTVYMRSTERRFD